MSDESDVANNPIFKSTSIFCSGSSKVVSDKHNPQTARSGSKVFSLMVDPSVSSTKSCSVCSKNHSVENCFKFKSMKIEERRSFAKDRQLCFGCLGQGHRIKYCKQRATCTKCGKRHPTLIHLDRVNAVEGEASSPAKKVEVPANATSVSCYTNHNSSRTLTSMIVPVYVSSSERPSEEFMTYAMLDTQSDSSFVSNSLEKSLNLKGDEVRLKLSTMASSAMIVDCHVIKDLNIRGLNSQKTITVPKLYTKNVIPADKNAVPTPNTAKAWPHLQTIAKEISPLQNCEIGLLIGYNCPQALTPRQVICGEGEQPFAVRTDLGWSIVGGQSRQSVFCHKTSIREVRISGRDELSVLESDFKLVKEEMVSQEDIRFRRMEDEKRQLAIGHLQLPLPFKARPSLPNNRSLAEKRLQYLQKWWPGGDIDLTPVEYRVRVHLFGASSSPGCANFGMKHLASVRKEDLKLGTELIHNFYVDDGICSTHSVDEAVQIANEACQICRSGGLRLHKFCSNSKDVLSALPFVELSSDLQQVNLC